MWVERFTIVEIYITREGETIVRRDYWGAICDEGVMGRPDM